MFLSDAFLWMCNMPILYWIITLLSDKALLIGLAAAASNLENVHRINWALFKIHSFSFLQWLRCCVRWKIIPLRSITCYVCLHVCRVSSPVDGKSLEGVSSVKIQQDSEFEMDGRNIRCTEVCTAWCPHNEFLVVISGSRPVSPIRFSICWSLQTFPYLPSSHHQLSFRERLPPPAALPSARTSPCSWPMDSTLSRSESPQTRTW